jgi:hypothetical protein
MNQTIKAVEATDDMIVERVSMPGHTLRKVKVPKSKEEGRVTFQSVIHNDGEWKFQPGEVLLEPDKEVQVLAQL